MSQSLNQENNGSSLDQLLQGAATAMSSCGSSDVTSLASTSARTAAAGVISDTASAYCSWTSQRRTVGQLAEDTDSSSTVVSTARQLIADLQDLLNSPAPTAVAATEQLDESKLMLSAEQPQKKQAPMLMKAGHNRGSFVGSNGALDDNRSNNNSRSSSHQKLEAQPEPQEPPLELQACNGLCVVFANYANFLPASTVLQASSSCPTPTGERRCGTQTEIGGSLIDDDEIAEEIEDAEAIEGSPRQLMARANQVRDAAAAIGRLFNSRLEFTVFIHWNKSRRETLRLLRQTAAAMSEAGRDCCFVFCLGRGGRDHFEAASGGVVTLTDILATLAVGQRGRLPPVFVIGELTPAPALEPDSATSERSSASTMNSRPTTSKSLPLSRLSLPSNHLLLWALGAPEMTDLLVEQLTRTASNSGCGNKDVASTVAGIAEWIRRRRNGMSTRVGSDASTGCTDEEVIRRVRQQCCCRFVSKLDRLVYLASPDCI